MNFPNYKIEETLLNKYSLIAGVDEVGRGCLAGPVVAASVVLPSDHSFLVGLNDSKKMSELQREKLNYEILKNVDNIAIGVVFNDVVDVVNILNATFIAMAKSVITLPQFADFLLIDGNRFKPIFPEVSHIPYQTIVKGDAKSLSIAAASVVAKVARDSFMVHIAERMYPEYQFAKHKGYATKLHLEMLEKYGPSPIHRKTFLKKFFARQLSLF